MKANEAGLMSNVAATALRTDGVAHLPSLFDPEVIRRTHRHLQATRPEVFAKPAEDADRLRVGKRRYLFPILLGSETGTLDIVFHPELMRFFAMALGDSWEVEAFGIMVALPGATDQSLHRDGGLMYPETGLDRVIPATALTVSFPLVDCDLTNGPTCFVKGTHRFPDKLATAADAEPAPLHIGDCLAWDYRVQHFGAGNNSAEPRPLLYATVCRSFWADHKNLVPGHNARLAMAREEVEGLDDSIRRRIIRADCGDGRPALSEQDYRRLVIPADKSA